jgi:hypothetical protein
MEPKSFEVEFQTKQGFEVRFSKSVQSSMLDESLDVLKYGLILMEPHKNIGLQFGSYFLSYL